MGLSRFTNVLEDSCVGSSALGRLSRCSRHKVLEIM